MGLCQKNSNRINQNYCLGPGPWFICGVGWSRVEEGVETRKQMWNVLTIFYHHHQNTFYKLYIYNDVIFTSPFFVFCHWLAQKNWSWSCPIKTVSSKLFSKLQVVGDRWEAIASSPSPPGFSWAGVGVGSGWWGMCFWSFQLDFRKHTTIHTWWLAVYTTNFFSSR